MSEQKITFREKLFKALPPIGRLVVASRSPERISFLHYLYPGVEIVPHPGGREANVKYVDGIATGKVDAIPDWVWQRYDSIPTVIVAGDTRVSVPAVVDGTVQMVSRGKPASFEDIQSNFLQIGEACRLNPGACLYDLNTGSGCKLAGTGFAHDTRVDRTVTLATHIVTQLGTKEGFEGYMQIADRIFISPPSGRGRDRLLGMCGGISLEVLTAMKAIDGVNFCSQNDPEFVRELALAIYQARIGIMSKAMKPFDPDFLLRRSFWINEVVLPEIKKLTEKR